MTLRRIAPLLASSLVLLSIVACKSPAPAGDAAAAPGADSPTMATVAANGVMGTYNGTLTRGTEVTQNYAFTVLTDRNGTPQLGFWEFCNIDFPGADGTYTAAPNSSCLVNLDGSGNKQHNVTGGTATIADGAINATITFEGGTVWSFVGNR